MRYTLIILFLAFLVGCKTQGLTRPIKDSKVFQQGFTGVVIYDPIRKKTLFAQNDDKYFTPASNTKLFTFYVTNKILKPKVNSLNYLEQGDSLIFWGTGDPSFLHPDFEYNSSVIDLLKSSEKELYLANNFHEIEAYGSGWSWNWYNYYYGPERSAFPIYGSIVRFYTDGFEGNLNFRPTFFSSNIKENIELQTTTYLIERERDANKFHYFIKADTLNIETDKPFITSPDLIMEMLRDTLKRKLTKIDYDLIKDKPHLKLKGIESDSLFKQMLTISDNFLAEQLLVLASDELFDSLNVKGVIDYGIDNFLSDLPDRPIWVDGSGLSSYNKFTPRSIIKLLDKIRSEVPMEKIIAFFPAGGQSGTIKSWYRSDTDKPFIYAKTGTLNGTHCLSGYLLTKSGKTLYFSFMHNNFLMGSSILKSEMEKVLFAFYKRY